MLTVRTDQLGDRVAQKRHALYANELFARSASILDPSFWGEVYRALPIELRSIEALLDTWSEQHTRPRWAAAALIIIVIIALAVALTRWWLPRIIGEPPIRASAKAWAALWVFAWFAIRTPLAAFAALLALTTLGLLTVRLEQIAQGLVAGMAAAAFGHGVARGLLAPEHPQRRLVQEDDETARCFYNHLVWASRALGVLIVLQVIHKTLFAPLVITVATNALFAAATAAFLVHLVLRLGTIKKNRGDALIAASWAHPLGLLMAVLIAVALVAGYAGVAAFISLRVIVAAAVFGALYLLLVITQTLFASINEQTAKGQMLAESLGIDPRTLGLSGALLSALIRVLLIVASFLLIIGPWEVSTADLFDTVRNIPFGFKIGEIRVSFQTILVGNRQSSCCSWSSCASCSAGSNGNCCPAPGSNPACSSPSSPSSAMSAPSRRSRSRSAGLGSICKDRTDRRRPVGGYRFRTAIDRFKLRVRPDPADRDGRSASATRSS